MTWNITIAGHGTHHNQRETDANVQAARFVEALLGAGHGVQSATFTLTDHKGQGVTPPDDIVDGKAYAAKHLAPPPAEDRIITEEAPPPS